MAVVAGDATTSVAAEVVAATVATMNVAEAALVVEVVVAAMVATMTVVAATTTAVTERAWLAILPGLYAMQWVMIWDCRLFV